MIKSVYNWTKATVLWLLVKKNRQLGVKYTKIGLDVFSYVTKYTKSSKDDLMAIHIIDQFNKAIIKTAPNTGPALTEVSEKINKISEGNLSKVGLKFSEKGLYASFGGLGATYNPQNGQIGFQVKI